MFSDETFVKFQVLTTFGTKNAAFRHVTPCSVEVSCLGYTQTRCLLLQCRTMGLGGWVRDNLPPEGVGSTFVHIVGKSLQVYTVLLAIGLRMVLIVQILHSVSTNNFKL